MNNSYTTKSPQPVYVTHRLPRTQLYVTVPHFACITRKCVSFNNTSSIKVILLYVTLKCGKEIMDGVQKMAT